MPVGAGTTYIELRARYDKLAKDVADARRLVDRETTQVESRFARVGERAGTMATRTRVASGAIAVGMGLAANAASDLAETVSFTDVTFKDATDTMLAWSEQSLDSLGIARQSALDAANQFGGLFNTLGKGTEESAKLSQQMVQLAVDMSSAKNVSLDEAVLALGSGLRGEAEPLRRFNVLLSESALQAYAAKENFKLHNGEMNEAQKVQARLGIIMEQTKDIQGDYSRTADSAANATRRAQESAKDAAATMGEALAPVMARAADIAGDAAQAFSELSPGIQNAVIGLGLLGVAVSPLAKGVELTAAAWTAYTVRASAATAANTAAVISMGRLQTGLASVAAGIGPVATGLRLLGAGAAGYAAIEGFERLDEKAEETGGALDGLVDVLERGADAVGFGAAQWSKGLFDEYILGVEDAEEGTKTHIRAAEALASALSGELKDGFQAAAGESDAYTDAIEDVDKKTKKAERSIRRFAGLTKDEFRDWERSASGSLNDLSGEFQELSDDAVVTADEILHAFEHQIEATRDFRDNLRTLITRGAKPTLIRDLIDMGDQGALWAEGLATANEDVTRAFFSMRRDAGKETQQLVGLVRDAGANVGRESRRIAGDLNDVGGSAKGAKNEVKGLTDQLRTLSQITGIKMNIVAQGDGLGDVGTGSRAAMAAHVMRLAPGPQVVSSAYRPGAITSSGNPSYHANKANPAQDIAGANLMAVAQVAERLYGPRLAELIYTPLGYSIKNGRRVAPIAAADHYDHVHLADQGGHFRGPGLVAMGRMDEYMVPAQKVGPLPAAFSGPVEIVGNLRIVNWETGEARMEGVAVRADERGRRRDARDRRIRSQAS